MMIEHQNRQVQEEMGDTSALSEEFLKYEEKPKADKSADKLKWWSKQDDLPILQHIEVTELLWWDHLQRALRISLHIWS